MIRLFLELQGLLKRRGLGLIAPSEDQI